MSFLDRFNHLAQDRKTTVKDAASAVAVAWPWRVSVSEQLQP